MKHLKRNIILSILAMVFCGGFLCGEAWADELISSESYNGYDITCYHEMSQYFYVKVSAYKNGSYDSFYLTKEGVGSREAVMLVGSCSTAISNFKSSVDGGDVTITKNGTTGSRDSEDDSESNNYQTNNGQYDHQNTGRATILKSCDTDGGEADIRCLVDIVVNIFTVGVGVLGVAGIIIVGIQYLTAAGDEAKMTKAKRRMYEIVIGITLYMVAYAVLKWLLPTYN